MQIDTTRFLLLSAAIAAASCTINSKEGDDDGAGGAGGTGNQGGAGATGGGEGGTGATGGSATGGGGGAGGGTGGGGCDDSMGTPAECTSLGTDCQPYCEAATNKFKPAVAEAATTCLAASTDCILDGFKCQVEALKGACADSSADDECATAEAACPPPVAGEPTCHELMDGMTQAGRDALLACAQTDCSFGLYSCAEGVLFGP
jgi:hypothetical protein